MKKLRLFALLLALCFALTACGAETPAVDTPDDGSQQNQPDQDAGSTVTSDSDLFTQRDLRTTYDEAKAAVVTLSGTTASSTSNAVSVQGSTVTILDEGTYILTGTLTDGQILVSAPADAKTQLVLRGASIHSSSSAALYVKTADKVFVTLEGENTLTGGESFTAIDENNIDGAVYSKADLTFNGSGSLTVTSPVGHGIVCKDDLVFTGGQFTVNSASHGLDVNDSVRFTGAALAIDAGKDGIHVENADDAALGLVYIAGGTLKIKAEGDGISSGYYTQINGGVFDLLCGGGYENGTKANSGGYGDFMGGHRLGGGGGGNSSTSQTDGTSMKGIKSGSGILIGGGIFTIDSADDAVHAASDVIINGGTWNIASGDDAVHSDTALTVTAGTFEISQSYEGLEAEKIYIRGGEFEIHASDDGLNAAGGTDSSGGGGRDEMFGGRPGGGGPGGMGGMGGNANACIEVSGGQMKIYSGGDGLDSNGNLRISGGYTYVTNPTSGDVSVLDSQYTPVITGGTYIGLGISSMMAQSFGGESTQGVIACTCGTQTAGSQLIIKDSSGKEVLNLTTEYRTVLLIISTPQIVSGESYDITIGAVSGTLSAE